MEQIKSKSNTITLVVSGVNAEDRYLFNELAAFTGGLHHLSRGEVMSHMIRETAIRAFGENGVEQQLEEYKQGITTHQLDEPN